MQAVGCILWSLDSGGISSKNLAMAISKSYNTHSQVRSLRRNFPRVTESTMVTMGWACRGNTSLDLEPKFWPDKQIHLENFSLSKVARNYHVYTWGCNMVQLRDSGRSSRITVRDCEAMEDWAGDQ